MDDIELRKKSAKDLLESGEPGKAIEILVQLEAQNDPWSKYILAGCYSRGTGVSQDQARANQLLLESAELGFADAQALYGNNLAYGIGAEKDVKSGLEYLNKAANAANPMAFYVLGELSLKGETGFVAEPEKAIEYFTKASELGYHPAMQRLGWMYGHGIGAEKDLARALFLETTAADLGNGIAAFNASGSYKAGEGTPVDHEKFIHYLKIAADKNLVYAIHNLAAAYCKGIETEQDLHQGRQLYERAAYMGNGLSSYNLSSMYERGEGGAKDLALAAVWASTAIAQYCHQAKGSFERLISSMSTEEIERTVDCIKGGADNGLHWAQITLAGLYQRGYLVDQSDEQAAHWRAEAEKTTNQTDFIRDQFKSSCFAEGMVKEAVEHEKNERFSQAFDVLYEAACLGDAHAQCKLGEYYQPGGIIGNDNQRSLYWFNKAAEQDYGPAELWLGIKFAAGDGVEKNQETANIYYMSAAHHGDSEAQSYMGHWYATGTNFEQDYEAAAYWFTLAARQGNLNALFDLGSMHENGFFFEKNVEKAREYFEYAAIGGAAMAQYELGKRLIGTGNSDDIKKGVHWLELACEQGYTNSLNRLGMMYIEGDIVESDPNKAFSLFQRSASLNDPEGYASLGVCYDKGVGCEKDKNKSIESYRTSADLGSAQGQFNLGWSYQFGDGVEQDYELARELFQRAADQSHPGGIRGLAQMYESGLGGLEVDLAKAVALYKNSADMGDVIAQFELGCLYEDGRGISVDREQAKNYYTMAALQGHRSAQLNLGTLYFQGIDGNPSYQDALLWFQKAYEHGHPKAAAMLGYIYLEGLGVDKDPARALSFYEHAAEQGDVYGQYNLAVLLNDEDGVAPNPERALFWIKQAASNNFPPAQIDLAVDFIKGELIEQDFSEAYKWALIAAELGYDRADGVKDYCEANADKQQLEKGRELAATHLHELGSGNA